MSDGDDPAPDTEANRQRRLGDAAKLVPLLAGVLMLVPVLWALGKSTSSAAVYIFTVWGLLILLAGVFSRALSRVAWLRPGDETRRDQQP